MDPEELRNLLRRQPFRPFSLVLTNNITHTIRHPEFAAVSRRVIHISTPDASESGPIDQDFVGVALLHIVQYEFLPPAAS